MITWHSKQSSSQFMFQCQRNRRIAGKIGVTKCSLLASSRMRYATTERMMCAIISHTLDAISHLPKQEQALPSNSVGNPGCHMSKQNVKKRSIGTPLRTLCHSRRPLHCRTLLRHYCQQPPGRKTSTTSILLCHMPVWRDYQQVLVALCSAACLRATAAAIARGWTCRG